MFWPAAIRNVTVVQRVIRALRREWVADLLLWVVIAAPVFVLAEAPAPGAPAGLPLLWVQIAAVPLLGIAAFVARRMPLAAAAVPPALGLAVKPDMYNGGFILAQVLLVYLLGRRAPGQRGRGASSPRCTRPGCCSCC